MAIQIGTIVWLKSGGPTMSVKYRDVNGDWVCNWFIGNEVREHSFAEAQLTEEEPEFNE